jgi:hypothetical protein
MEISQIYNNSVYSKNSLSVHLNASLTTTNDEAYREFIAKVYYKSDWLSGELIIYQEYNPDPDHIKPPITYLDYTLNLTEVPNGKHFLTFYAVEYGYYYPSLLEYYVLSANSSVTITFTIDTELPTISILSLANRTLNSPIPLNFTISEPTSKISYVLDNQENMTISSNTTLTNLPVGSHNITIYAWDNAGNVGASEIVYFTFRPNSVSMDLTVTFAVIIVLAVAVISILLYGRHRKTAKPS